MRPAWWAGLALLLSSCAYAQSAEDLKRELREKEAEVERLRERLRVLEQRADKPVSAATPAPAAATAAADADEARRGLERALVREGGLLLAPGELEIEPNFVYSHSSGSGFRRDTYSPGLAVRVGLHRRWQLDAELPYVFENVGQGGASRHASGIGDFTLGLSHQLLEERGSVPAVTGSIAYRADTGRNTVFESAAPVELGSGFDAVLATVTAVKRLAPLVVFGSYTYTHQFAETRAGLSVDPGATHDLRLGTILAASPESSLRAVFQQTFFDSTKLGGVAVPGTSDHAALLELGGTFLIRGTTALDVAIGAGLTRAAPDYRISIALPMRF
jgi:hypothetical protein